MQQLTLHLRQLTYKLFPNLADQPKSSQEQAIMTMILFYFLLPFFILGTGWLLWITEWRLFTEL